MSPLPSTATHSVADGHDTARKLAVVVNPGPVRRGALQLKGRCGLPAALATSDPPDAARASSAIAVVLIEARPARIRT